MLFISQSSYRYGHSKLNSCLLGYLLKKLGSVGRLEKEHEYHYKMGMMSYIIGKVTPNPLKQAPRLPLQS